MKVKSAAKKSRNKLTMWETMSEHDACWATSSRWTLTLTLMANNYSSKNIITANLHGRLQWEKMLWNEVEEKCAKRAPIAPSARLNIVTIARGALVVEEQIKKNVGQRKSRRASIWSAPEVGYNCQLIVLVAAVQLQRDGTITCVPNEITLICTGTPKGEEWASDVNVTQHFHATNGTLAGLTKNGQRS